MNIPTFHCVVLCAIILLKDFSTSSVEVFDIIGHVNSSLAWNRYFPVDNTDPFAESFQVEIEVYKDATLECPLVITVHQEQNVISWHLPKNTSYDGKPYITRMGGRTLCMASSKHKNSDRVYVLLSTCSLSNVRFKMVVYTTKDAYIPVNEPVKSLISPNYPRFYPFKFSSQEKDEQVVLIDVRSNEVACMTVSVQSPKCPVLDQEDNIQFEGYWQTMSSVSLMSIRKTDFPDGFFLVFVVHRDNTMCNEYEGIDPFILPQMDFSNMDPKQKNVTIRITEGLPFSEYFYPMFFPVALFAILIVVTLCLFVCFYAKMSTGKMEDGSSSAAPSPPIDIETMTNSGRSRSSASSSISDSHSHLSIPPNPSDEAYLVGVNNRNILQEDMQQYPCVSDLVTKIPTKLVKNTHRYYWIIFTVAIFYVVPVFQLLGTYEQVLLKTGNHDLCYYNYNCAHPLGKFIDFNHIYSNVGYIILGVFFMLFVRIKQFVYYKKYAQLGNSIDLIDDLVDTGEPPPPFTEQHYGTIQHFGIYYALGFALIMEGILSAAYHVCPNRSNFQFDTAFMYVISVLCMVKVYQFRHPVHIHAITTFAVLAVIAAISVLGLLVAQFYVALFFSIFHMLAVLFIQIYMYYIGCIGIDGVFVTGLALLKEMPAKWRKESWKRCCSPQHPRRVLLPLLVIPYNLIIIVVHFVKGNDFATHLLYIFVGNLLLYLTNYVILKMSYGEYKSLKAIQSCMYIPITIFLWVYALKYFTKPLTSWEESPSESRTENEECFLMGFYDYHDLWHFLSAAALFCSFMILLTLDDAIYNVPQKKIPVF